MEQKLDQLERGEIDAHVEDTTDLRAIADAAIAVEAAKALVRERVAIARAHGRSWTRIAAPLGVSRQAARERFSAAADEQAGGETMAAGALMTALAESLKDLDPHTPIPVPAWFTGPTVRGR